MEAFNRLVLQLTDTAAHKADNNDASASNPATQSIASKQDNPNSGILMLDATVAEQHIAFPTDLKLLNEGRQQLERIIEQVCKAGSLQQPRMYKRIARKQYLIIAKRNAKPKRTSEKASVSNYNMYKET